MWDLIALIPDHCLSIYYENKYPLPSESTMSQNPCRHKIDKTTWFYIKCVMELTDFVRVVTAASDL